jgi:hypothetical protein
MRAMFAIPSAGAGFFFSAWLAMVFWSIVAPEVGLRTIDYLMAMVVAIGQWLVVAPVIGAVTRERK